MNKKERKIKNDLQLKKLANINKLLQNHILTNKERKFFTELKLKTEKYLKSRKLK